MNDRLNYLLYEVSEMMVRRWGQPWRWRARYRCHGSSECCQYVDWPNDNHPSRRLDAPWWKPR